jgi:hypothetical protein
MSARKTPPSAAPRRSFEVGPRAAEPRASAACAATAGRRLLTWKGTHSYIPDHCVFCSCDRFTCTFVLGVRCRLGRCRLVDEIPGALQVLEPRRGLVVDAALVDEHSFAVDHVHMRGGARAVRVPDSVERNRLRRGTKPSDRYF